MKKAYITPEVVVWGDVETLTQGPIKPSLNDGLIGEGNNTNIGCQPSDFKGPDYKLCS